jgi:hypothetical protein
MTTTPEPVQAIVMSESAFLTDAITDVQTQMGRVDTKTSMLLAGALTSLSVGVALLAKVHLPGPVTAGAVLTVAFIAVAVFLLLTGVRPSLTGNHGFVRSAAAATPAALLGDLNNTDREHAAYYAHRLHTLSRILRRKYRLVRLATDLLRAALLIAGLTAALALFL